jgi:hypothetical protein
MRANNAHVEILSSLNDQEILEAISKLSGTVGVFGECDSGKLYFNQTEYGKTTINVSVTCPVEGGKRTYRDRFSVGIADRRGQTVLRIGPARRPLLPWNQMRQSGNWNNPDNWDYLVTFAKGDKTMLECRRRMPGVISEYASRVLDLGKRIGRKTDSKAVAQGTLMGEGVELLGDVTIDAEDMAVAGNISW